MKKIPVVLFFAMLAGFVPLQAKTSQSEAGSKSGTVVSLRKHFMPADFIGGVISDEIPQPQKYVYDIEIRAGCNLYVGRYESSKNQVPAVFDLNQVVSVRMNDGLMTLTPPQGGQSVTTVVISTELASGCPESE